MNPLTRLKVFSLVTLWVLLISLVMPLAAFADDGVPPTEEPIIQEPVDQGSAEQVTGEEAAAPEEPAATEETAPAEEPIATDEAIMPEDSIEAEAPAAVENVAPVEDLATEEVTVAEVLEAAPEGTALVVLDENGEPLPLVTEEATQAAVNGDPMWCPDGQVPGEPGCTGSFSTFTGPDGLLPYLIANKFVYNGPGTIYVAQSYTTAGELPGPIVIEQIAGYGLTTLTIQGGWDGALFPLPSTIAGTTTFNKELQIVWHGTVTLNDVIFDTNGLSITSGSHSIKLDNVEASNNASGYGATLVATDSITIHDSRFNDNNGGGVYVYSYGDVLITDITANGNGLVGVFVQNFISPGKNVAVERSIFNGNDWIGVAIHSAGDVSLTDVTADGNNQQGAYVETTGKILIDPSSFSGNTQDGAYLDTPLDATIICSEFNNNGGYGVDAANVGGTLSLNDVSLSGNSDDINPGSGDIVTETGGCSSSNGSDDTSSSRGDGATPASGQGSVLPPSGGKLPIEIIPVTGGASSALLDCALFGGTTLALPNGDNLTFMCPTIGEASLASIDPQDLPGVLPEGAEFVSGLEGALENGNTPPFPGPLVVSFAIPDDMEGEDLAILFWNSSEWEELDGSITADGQFQAVTDLIGIFMLVTE